MNQKFLDEPSRLSKTKQHEHGAASQVHLQCFGCTREKRTMASQVAGPSSILPLVQQRDCGRSAVLSASGASLAQIAIDECS